MICVHCSHDLFTNHMIYVYWSHDLFTNHMIYAHWSHDLCSLNRWSRTRSDGPCLTTPSHTSSQYRTVSSLRGKDRTSLRRCLEWWHSAGEPRRMEATVLAQLLAWGIVPRILSLLLPLPRYWQHGSNCWTPNLSPSSLSLAPTSSLSLFLSHVSSNSGCNAW